MRNKNSKSYKWAYIPLVFSSAAILATQVSANPSQQYQEPRQVGSANYEYVGGRTQVGGYITDDGDTSIDINHVFSETNNSSSSIGLWGGIDVDEGEPEGGVQLNHNWVSRDRSGNASHVNKVTAAYDRTEDKHEKATVGYGQERENMFWEGHVSKGLSGKKKTGSTHNNRDVSSKAYDYGVGGSVGTFLKGSNMRIRAGVDHEWGDDVAFDEDDATNTTLSAGVEKFFQGTPHSVSLDVAASRKDGGTELVGEDDTDVHASLGYHYDFGGASIYQPDQRYRRVRVEVPGQGRPARYAKKPLYKRVATYKNVPVYGKKTVNKQHKQLVKSTMELEGQTFFKLNSSRLIPSAQTRLKQIAHEIRKNGYRGAIRITGNTCGLGDPVYDQRLSEQRAKAVRSFLIKNGFKADHLIARGLGKGHPKYPNTPSQGFKNRRVDIEYVTERKSYKTVNRTEQRNVQTGTRRVATGFKNVPAGFKNVMIDSGAIGSPRVIWKTEAIKTSPAWIKRALHNNIKHDRNVNTYNTTAGAGVDIPTPVNQAPVAVNDVKTTACNEPITIDALSNDTDADSLTITDVATPQYGTAEIVNNQILYTPNADACGQSETFTYTISDGTETATADITVTIDADTNTDNVKPVAVDDKRTAKCDAITINVLENDYDTDGDTLRLISVGNANLGTAVLSGNSIVYTPDKDCGIGTDKFSYTINDGNGHTASANVKVTIEGVPGCNTDCTVAESDEAFTTKNNAVVINVLENDKGHGLRVIDVDTPKHGSVINMGSSIKYTPQHGYTGTDSFWYEIEDSSGYKDSKLVLVYIEEGCAANTKCN